MSGEIIDCLNLWVVVLSRFFLIFLISYGYFKILKKKARNILRVAEGSKVRHFTGTVNNRRRLRGGGKGGGRQGRRKRKRALQVPI